MVRIDFTEDQLNLICRAVNLLNSTVCILANGCDENRLCNEIVHKIEGAEE